MPMRRLEHLNTKECLWVYVLRILKDVPTHAYLLRTEVNLRFGFKPGSVTAYKVLYLLRRSGLVNKTEQGRKVVYSITPKGRQKLKKAVDFYKKRVKFLS